jgi:hypothetical protein
MLGESSFLHHKTETGAPECLNSWEIMTTTIFLSDYMLKMSGYEYETRSYWL